MALSSPVPPAAMIRLNCAARVLAIPLPLLVVFHCTVDLAGCHAVCEEEEVARLKYGVACVLLWKGAPSLLCSQTQATKRSTVTHQT